MPAVPGDAIQVPVVLSEAVEDPVEVGVCAAVVPIPTWHKKQARAGEPAVPSPWKWLAGQAPGIL